ncbi:hypothetical protein Rhe02_89570 [Rhizocola hellebori]|uniref:MoxR domain-containing protein n=1 Tax=Rhizocola hellebori TaxID=1392758 RepID=A0A8J3QHC6_9ACTN|nr:AAA family ATPase [Rhizocola hellebori]GIH10890.1 hypothetical protein Rhe02_89570 [Rhizocola hellebori]
MAHSHETLTRVRQFDAMRATLDDAYVGRGDMIRLLQLAVICQEHLLLIGPSGTAKTDIAGRFTRMLSQSTRFHAMLTRFTEPAELFGPLDIDELTTGKRYSVHTEGMLPQAHFAFLDEVFHASAAILNALHTLLNERVYLNGSRAQPAPLLTLIGAANALPDDPGLRPFADRFLLRLSVQPVAENRLHELLEAGARRERLRSPGAGETDPAMPLADLMQLHRSLPDVRMNDVGDLYEDVVRDLLSLGVQLSDRRIVRAQRLIAGAALIDGHDRARPQHFWPLYHIWCEVSDEDAVRRRIDDVVLADGGLPRMRRSVEEVVAEAAAIVGQTERHTPGALGTGAALGRLARLRKELHRDHPQADAAAEQIGSMIHRLFQRLEDEEQ